MMTLDLDRLLTGTHPEASFHDSLLQRLSLDFSGGTAELRFLIPITYTDSHPSHPIYRSGVLILTGLLFASVESPRTPILKCLEKPMWITADGPFPNPKVKVNLHVPPDLPEHAFCHYFFASNTNSFIVLAATTPFSSGTQSRQPHELPGFIRWVAQVLESGRQRCER